MLRQHDQRIRAAHLRQRLDHAARQVGGMTRGNQMNYQLAVRRRLENRTTRFELLAQFLEVDEVAVMRERKSAACVLDHERLAVLEIRRTGSRVAIVANRSRPFEPVDDLGIENVGDQSHPAMRDERLAVGRDDSGRLLPPMLQRIEAEIYQVGCLGMAIDAEDTAFLVEAVEIRLVTADLDRKFARRHQRSLPGSASSWSRLRSATSSSITICPIGAAIRRRGRIATRPITRHSSDEKISCKTSIFSADADTITVEGPSPKRLPAPESESRSKLTSAPSGPSGLKQASANATASPPSETSCADLINPLSAHSTSPLTSLRSRPRSIAGSSPLGIPKSAAYSLPASPGGLVRTITITSPSNLKCCFR